MKRNWQIMINVHLVIIMTIFALGCIQTPIDKMLRNKKDRSAILLQLIEKNDITSLPSKFIIVDSSRIACTQVMNTNRESFTLAAVSYDVHKLGSGDRGHIFIFDSSEKCLFHSPDNTPAIMSDNSPYDMYFCDMTGDGSIEKLIAFDLYETGKVENSLTFLRHAFQVWRISQKKNEILLEVHYSIFGKDRKGAISPRLTWPVSSGNPPVTHVGEGTPNIILGELTKKPLVVFKWSPIKQRYVWDTTSSDRWAVEYPIAQHKNAADPKGRAAD